MSGHKKKESESKHHPSRDQAYVDPAAHDPKKWHDQYLDPKILGEPSEAERAEQDARSIQQPKDHELPKD